MRLMKKDKSHLAMLILLLSLGMLGTPVSSYADHPHPAGITAEAPTENMAEHAMEDMNTTNDPEPGSDGSGAAKGCAAGAAIGTAFAPGVGTVAGCIVAGIWGWFW